MCGGWYVWGKVGVEDSKCGGRLVLRTVSVEDG